MSRSGHESASRHAGCRSGISFALGLLLFVELVFVAPRAIAAPLSVGLRGTAMLGTSAVNQHGSPITVVGLSGIAHRGGTIFAAVMDNSNVVVHLDVRFAADGTITSANITGALSLSDAPRDYEGIAYTNAQTGSVWLADEAAPQLREYDLATGALRRTIVAPEKFASRRAGFGWESLTRQPGGSRLWTANEEALSADGQRSSPTDGTVVRLVRYDAEGDSFSPAAEYAYRVEPWHGTDSTSTTAERGGLVELVALPDGTLLSLERSLAFSGPLPSFQSRLYQLDFASATNVAALPNLTPPHTFVPVAKRLVWSGAAAGPLGMNLEGLCLGPRLPNGNATLIGIVDDGGTSDPLSANTVVAFEITSPLPLPGVPGDANMDGVVNRADAAILARSFGVASGAMWEDGDFDGDGAVGLLDMAELAAHQTPHTVASAAEAVAVPEPGVALLAGCGAAAFASIAAFRIWRRRRTSPRC